MRPLANKGRVRHDDVNRVARRAIGLMCSNGLRNMALVLISCIPTWGELSVAKWRCPTSRMPRWMVAATKGGKAKKDDFLI